MTEQEVEYPRCRSVFWESDQLKMIDQRQLPGKFVVVGCDTVSEVAERIQNMTVRGAPAIGGAGGFGMAIAARASAAITCESLVDDLKAAKTELDASRPTAVNLSWATDRIVKAAQFMAQAGWAVGDVKQAVLQEAQALADEDVAVNRRMAKFGADLLETGRCRVIHHCNTGALATVDVGTALGVIYELHEQGKGVSVMVDETRPRLQGARLTAWELTREKVPFRLMADSASGPLLRTGQIDAVLFGADRVAFNGDTANKIGTYNLSVVARENGVPVYAVVPTSTIDLECATGDDIEIEERSGDEVRCVRGVLTAPASCDVFNPAFDVTPAKYITAIVTEEGVCYPPFRKSLQEAKARAQAREKEHWQTRVEAWTNKTTAAASSC